jgi:hypothetical protein
MPSKQARAAAERPRCPECQMRMMPVEGLNRDPDRRTFECLRCGHLERPPGRHSQAAEPWSGPKQVVRLDHISPLK